MRQWLYILAVLLAATGLYVWFLEYYEKKPERVYVGLQGEARFNEFFAAELLLRELDIEAESQDTLRPSSWLPPHTDTLLTRLGPDITSVAESRLLMNWVRLGGHLVLLPALEETADVTLFLAELDVVLFDHDVAQRDGDEGAPDDEQQPDYLLNLNVVKSYIEIVGDDSVRVTLSEPRGFVATRSQSESGFITIFATDAWFRNGLITDRDHARLFLDSVAGFVDPGKVWLFYDTEFTPLWRLIWDAARYLVLGLMLAFAVWLWSRMPRFGPRLPMPSGARRSIIEHVGAAGRFIWQNNASAALVRASVTAVIGKAERRHPGIGRLARDKQAAAIGKLAEEDPQAILQALLPDAHDRPREFAQHMKLLQKIRNKL